MPQQQGTMTAERQMLDMNLNVFEEEEMQGEQEYESGDHDHENAETNSTANQLRKRGRCHRHTPDQARKMEAFFKECPHPNKKQRSQLGEELGLEQTQVKFWFQNKRTQIKSKNEHKENTQLRVQNNKLREENMKYREALSSACCCSCGYLVAVRNVSSDDHHFRMENARLREEIDRISATAAKYVGKRITGSTDTPSS